MKNAILLLVFFTICNFSTTVYATTYYARTTGNWSGSVWSTSPTGTASLAAIDFTDDVVIQDGVTLTANLESITVNSLTIGGGTSGKLQLDSYIFYNALSTPVQFTSLVMITGDVIVNQGAMLTTVNETGFIPSNIIIGGNLVVDGTLSTNTNPLGFTFNKNGVTIISGKGVLSFNDITIGTNNNILLATDITNNGTITVSGGNLYVGYLKTLTLGAGVVVSSSKSVNVLGTINCNTNIISDATLNTGSFILVGTSTVTPTGNITFGSSSIASVSSITGVSIGMGISGLGIPTGTFVTGVSAGIITLSQTATATASTVALTINSAGTIESSHTSGIASNITTTTKTFSSLGNYIFDNTAAQSVSSFTTSPTANTVNNLTINNAGGVSFSDGITVNGSLTLTTGTLTNSTNNITMGNGATIVRTEGALTNTPPVFTTSVNIIYNGSANITTGSELPISTSILNNVTIANSGTASNNTVTLATNSNTTINGTLNLTNGTLVIGDNTLTFQNGNTPITLLTGTLTVSTTSNLIFGTVGNLGGTAFTIPDNAFITAPEFNNFTLNRTNSLTLNNQFFALRGKLTLTNGTLILPANYIFTLRSLSISGTALVDVVGSGAAIQYNTGAAFLAERFIPQSRRAYRDIAPMVNSGTGTFFTNWQESGTNNNGFGTQITGKVGAYPGGVDATTGFDITTTGNKSLSSYNVNTTTGNASFVNYSSTINTSTDTLSAFKAYRLTVRGNRQNNLFVDNAASNATCILRSTGKLITGTVAYTKNGVTNNGNTNTDIRLNFGDVTGFAMLGNPYMSPIDWVNMMANSNNTNIQQTYWVLDPNVGTVGAYVTYNASTGSSNGSSQVNKFIQPGQGFFIKNNNSTSPTLEIREADKAASTTNLVTVFGQGNNVLLSKMAFLLDRWIDTAYVSMDGDVVCFSNNFTDAIGVEDASKLTNQTENLGIISNGIMLSNEGRLPVKATDSIAFKLWQTTVGINYQLQINLSTFSANGLQPFLKDRFTKTQTLLQLGVVNKYQFTTNADTASYNNRFTIVFTANVVLPISFKTITANKVNNQVKIDWSAIETNVAFYEVEHSLNGQQFIKILTVNATVNSNGSVQNYTANHTTPIAGNNYYRVKSIEQNGAINYSNTVLVNMTKAEASISIYPNPVTNRITNIQIVNLAKFNYNVILYNTAGQGVYSTYINYKSGSEIHELALPQSLSSGTYQMAITGNGFSKVLSVIIK